MSVKLINLSFISKKTRTCGYVNHEDSNYKPNIKTQSWANN